MADRVRQWKSVRNIYIYNHPQTDCFVVSQLFSVARHARLSKLWSKPGFRPFRIDIILTATNDLTWPPPPMMTSDMVERCWANIGFFLYQLDLDVRRLVRRLERLLCIYIYIYIYSPIYIYIYSSYIYMCVCVCVCVFVNEPGDLGSIPGRVIPKTQKMVLDATLLNTQYYKVMIKGKVEQSRERSSAFSYTLV